MRFIAVSQWTKEKLISHGVRADLIEVVPNSLPEARIAGFPRRGRYDRPGIRSAIVVSRLDPMKRVGILLDALDRGPTELAEMSFTIFGLGPEMAPLQARAAGSHPNVRFAGFSSDIPDRMAAADLLVHVSPAEPFGLVVLEAMAANLAVLVADAAGPGAIVEDGVNGFKFRPEDPADLAEKLTQLQHAPAEVLNAVVAGGRRTVEQTYSARRMLGKYRELFSPA